MPFMGWKRYVHLTEESTWGTYNSGGTHIYVPVTSYGVAVTRENQQADLFTGLRQRRHNRAFRGTVAGNITMPLYAQHVNSKSIAEHILTWAFSAPSSDTLTSFTGELNEDGVDDKRHNGLRINSLTISGANGGPVNLSIDVIGKSEDGGITPEAIPVSDPMPIEFLMSDATLALETDETSSASVGGAGNEQEILAFSLTLQNNLEALHVNSFWPNYLLAGVRMVDFSMTILKETNTYDAMRRDSAININNAVFTLLGRHGGSGASGDYTSLSIDLDRLHVANVNDLPPSLNTTVQQEVSYISLKPDSTQNDIDLTWALV